MKHYKSHNKEFGNVNIHISSNLPDRKMLQTKGIDVGEIYT
jgi:hypothetical protein